MRIIVLIFFLLPLAASAQVMKGNVFVGGSISTSNSDQKAASFNNGYTNLQAGPQIGIFISSRTAVGIGLSFSYDHQTSDIEKYVSHSYEAAPFVRYYVPIADKFYFALQGTWNIGSGRVQNSDQSVIPSVIIKQKAFSTGIAVSPTFVYFPTSRWAIQGAFVAAGWDYDRVSTQSQATIRTNRVYLNGGYISAGVAYFFNRKN